MVKSKYPEHWLEAARRRTVCSLQLAAWCGGGGGGQRVVPPLGTRRSTSHRVHPTQGLWRLICMRSLNGQWARLAGHAGSRTGLAGLRREPAPTAGVVAEAAGRARQCSLVFSLSGASGGPDNHELSGECGGSTGGQGTENIGRLFQTGFQIPGGYASGGSGGRERVKEWYFLPDLRVLGSYSRRGMCGAAGPGLQGPRAASPRLASQRCKGLGQRGSAGRKVPGSGKVAGGRPAPPLPVTACRVTLDLLALPPASVSFGRELKTANLQEV